MIEQKKLPFKKRLTCRRISYGEYTKEQIICSGTVLETKTKTNTASTESSSHLKCSSGSSVEVDSASAKKPTAATSSSSTTSQTKNETITVRGFKVCTGIKRKMGLDDMITSNLPQSNIVVKKMKSCERAKTSTSSSTVRTYIFV